LREAIPVDLQGAVEAMQERLGVLPMATGRVEVAEGMAHATNSLSCQCRTPRDETKLIVHKPKVSTFRL
jgi:hypothetical protein